MRVAKETLQVVRGERPMEQSYWAAARDLRAEFVLTSIPVVGELVLAFEFMSGKEAATGRRMSDDERAISGLFAVMPLIVSEIGGAVASGAKVTRRAVTLALDDLKIYSIWRTLQRIPRSIELAIGLKVLPDKTFAELVDLLHQVKAAQRLNLLEFLTNKQLARLNYMVSRMRDASRTAMWGDRKGIGFAAQERLHADEARGEGQAARAGRPRAFSGKERRRCHPSSRGQSDHVPEDCRSQW
jgi:hypothetical protein